ncbi:MAG: hypothetical protein Q8K63_13795, partial [Acidimicrobiales bacterium]|nr:hypothetical protein [Acidimicrobiales bacterium]
MPKLTLGDAVAEWMHEWLIQPNGPRAGKPFRLTLGQYRFLLWWYALDELTQWLFMAAARRQVKGAGKSPFAGALALAEFCGPVRLERFDDRVPGGCVGKAVHMPLVQIAATAESQTANTMRMVRAFAPKGSPIVEEYFLDPGKTRYYKAPEGTLEIITASATAAEGAEASFVVADETEHWKPSNGGPELANTLQDNLAKSGSRMMETSNAWVPGIESVAEATWDAWVAQEEGRTRDDGSILYDAVIAPPNTDLNDVESLRAALEFVYGDCDWKKPSPDEPPDVQAIMRRIWNPSSKVDDSMRKYLNWPTVDTSAWTSPQEWAALANRDIVVDAGEEIVAFFDGSKSRDATALVGCRMSDGHVFTIGTWEPNPAHNDDDAVPVDEIDATVSQMFDLWDVRAFFGDVQEWESFVKVDWPKRYSAQLDVMAVPTGRDQQWIAWDMRSHTLEFTRACELVEAEIRDRQFTHDDNPVLARHVANTRRRTNRWGVSIGKETPSSSRKIDAAVCMVGARMVRRIVQAAAPVKKTDKGE